MRIWDIPPEYLDRDHLLGEHRELHALWVILVDKRTGYRHHPETLRWVGKLGALHRRHEMLAAEMQRRGYRHESPLDWGAVPPGERDLEQDEQLLTISEQFALLRRKGGLLSPPPDLHERSAPLEGLSETSGDSASNDNVSDR